MEQAKRVELKVSPLAALLGVSAVAVGGILLKRWADKKEEERYYELYNAGMQKLEDFHADLVQEYEDGTAWNLMHDPASNVHYYAPTLFRVEDYINGALMLAQYLRTDLKYNWVEESPVFEEDRHATALLFLYPHSMHWDIMARLYSNITENHAHPMTDVNLYLDDGGLELLRNNAPGLFMAVDPDTYEISQAGKNWLDEYFEDYSSPQPPTVAHELVQIRQI